LKLRNSRSQFSYFPCISRRFFRTARRRLHLFGRRFRAWTSPCVFSWNRTIWPITATFPWPRGHSRRGAFGLGGPIGPNAPNGILAQGLSWLYVSNTCLIGVE